MTNFKPCVLGVDDSTLQEIWRSRMGATLRRVWYLGAERWSSSENRSGQLDAADNGVLLDFGPQHQSVVVTWAMDGYQQGLAFVDCNALNDKPTDVSGQGGWAAATSLALSQVVAYYHLAEEGLPEALWSLSLRFGASTDVSISLGRLDDGLVVYSPDDILVGFTEGALDQDGPSTRRVLLL